MPPNEGWSTSRRALCVVLVLLTLAYFGWLARNPIVDAAEWTADQVASAGDTWEDWSTRLQRMADEATEAEIEERTGDAVSQSVLIVVGSSADDAAFVLVALSPDADATVTLVPQSTYAMLPGYGEALLAEAMDYEGADLLELAVINLLGIRVDHVLELPTGSLAEAIGGPITIDLPVPLFEEDEQGVTNRVFDDGVQEVSAESIELLLVEPGIGDPFEWLQRQGAAWRGIFSSIEADEAIADRVGLGGFGGGQEVADLLLAVALSDDYSLTSLPVEVPEAGDPSTFVLPTGEVQAYVAGRFGHLLLREGERPRLEILNGNGRIGTARPVADLLVRLGFRVVRTDNADRFDYETTQVIAQGEDAEDAAREVALALGTESVFVELRLPSGVVDVSIIVGLDMPAGEG
jgi:hypothetical protein